jgi:hypothetical protein
MPYKLINKFGQKQDDKIYQTYEEAKRNIKNRHLSFFGGESAVIAPCDEEGNVQYCPKAKPIGWFW